MERQYCASIFVIDKEDKILLMYNKKLNMWLQPGGHIENDELPHETAIRECKEETGIDVEIVNRYKSVNPNPVFIEHYINKVGDMVDIQYYGVPLNNKLLNNESNETGWFSLEEIEKMNIDKEIIRKHKMYIESR
jgi:8-oxo-dGTP pyrophosphatase MutT (NUDIX family)